MLDNLTLRDLKELREHTGKTDIDEIFAPLSGESFSLEGVEVIQYLIYLVRRKTDSSYTLDDALDVSVDEMKDFLGASPLADKNVTGVNQVSGMNSSP